MHESTVHLVASSSFCSAQTSAQGPPHPALRANPFPKVTDLFCRLPLPTLIYQPEAVNLGDLMRLWVRARVQISTCTWLFKDRCRCTRHLGRQGAIPTANPSSRQSVFRVACGKKEKTTLSKTPTCVANFLCYHSIATPWLENINTISFQGMQPSTHAQDNLTDSPCPEDCRLVV